MERGYPQLRRTQECDTFKPVFEHYDDCLDCQPIKTAFRENNPDEDSQG